MFIGELEWTVEIWSTWALVILFILKKCSPIHKAPALRGVREGPDPLGYWFLLNNNKKFIILSFKFFEQKSVRTSDVSHANYNLKNNVYFGLHKNDKCVDLSITYLNLQKNISFGHFCVAIVNRISHCHFTCLWDMSLSKLWIAFIHFETCKYDFFIKNLI
jgi:hypothetical protein